MRFFVCCGPVQTPDGWYPDPSGRHELRRWEGGRWVDWVSTGGQVGAEPMPPPPASGGGTLTTEPVVHAVSADGTWKLTSLYGQLLATATADARATTVIDPAGVPTHQLRRSVAGSTAVVSLHDRADREVGRYEEVRAASASGFRVVGVGALLATLDGRPGDLTQLTLADPGGRPLGRLTDHGEGWTTELAHPFGPPLAELAALAALAVALARH